MLSDYKILNPTRFLKMVLFATVLCASSAHAIENANYQSNIEVNQTGTVNQIGKRQKLSTTASCDAYFKGTDNANNCRAGEVPIPAASWLFLLALIGFVGLSNKRKV